MYCADSLFLIEEQLGKKSSLDGHISLCAFLQIHVIVLYIIRGEKRSCSLLREDPQFWTYRLLSELMVRAADDDVRFLPYVFHKMMEKLSEESLWKLAVCGSLCCRCFCISDNEYADWPAIPSIPGFHHWTPEAGKESRSHVEGPYVVTTLLLHLEARAVHSYYPIIKLHHLK
ncbi:uncharacterized protein [Solanum lycopersicum]|uniref:uncharacterized protein isoform X3 n=1 Tax=Solanum lycopersicum TaxID=4081 RepID=UPI003747EEFA